MNQNIREILVDRFIKSPNRLIFSYLDSRSGNASLSYKELWEQSSKLALVLQNLTKVNEIILITIKPSIDFIVSVFACILAGRTFMPSYPTTSKQNMERTNSLIERYAISLLIDDKANNEWGEKFSCVSYTIETLKQMGRSIPEKVKLEPIPLANPLLLQASSGTTRYPKAIVIDNECLIECLSNMREALGVSSQDIGCSWLPPYHDMGLIGCVFLSIFADFPVYFMSPLSFFLDPLGWLKVISDYRVTITAAPNSAFDLCSARFEKNPTQGLDLSSLRIVINGAEMVRDKTMNRFAQLFQPSGFDRQMFKSSYGLAEATLMVACSSVDSQTYSRSFDQKSLRQGIAIPCSENDPDAVNLVSSGVAIPGMVFKIVDRDTYEIRQNYEVGEIWVKGTSLTYGYYRDEEKSTENFVMAPFENGEIYIRTGDSGFCDEQGRLFVIGRIKDLIKTSHGLVSAEEIEYTVDSLFQLDSSYRSAALIMENQTQSEIIIIKEILKNEKYQIDIQQINEHLGKMMSIQVDKIIYVSRGQIPRTTSGKIKHHAAIILLKYELFDVLGNGLR